MHTFRRAHPVTTSMYTATYRVTGMTCGHCVNAVTTEISEIPGVDTVKVDLDSGRVTVTSQAPLADEAVAAAVDEAGYTVLT
jgi:copper chaperone